MDAGPGKAGTPDADAVAQGSALVLHEIEHALTRVDDDRARGLLARVADLLLQIARIHHEMAGLSGRLDHSGAKISRILAVNGGWRRVVAALLAAPEQKFEKSAAISALRR